MTLILPNDIEADTAADAVELQQNYDAIENYINAEVINRSGQVAMTNPLLLSGPPTAASHAATKGYVDGQITSVGDTRYVNTAGDTMTGDLIVGGDPAADLAGVHLAETGRIYEKLNQANGNIPNLELSRVQFGGGVHLVNFLVGSGGSLVGSITSVSGSSIAYNTTSDQRLKERVGDADDALDLVNQLGSVVYRGRWIADQGQGEEWVFVNSQDAEGLVPFAVTGDPTGVDEEGNIRPQQFDHSSLVPLLLAAVSQLSARVQALEA